MLSQYFYHKSTSSPLVGGSPAVTLLNLNNNTIVLDGVIMEETELPGWYRYNYTKENGVHYAANFQSNNPDYVYGVEKDYLQPTYGGGFSNRSSQYDFNATDRENIKKILERLSKLEEKELPEQEEIDFTPIFDKIDEVKQTNNPEVTTSIGTLKMQITKLSDFLRKEQEREKKEMEKKHEEKMKEKDAEMEMIEKTFEMVSKEYEDKIAEKESENDSLLEDIEEMLEEINTKTEEEKKAIADEIKNKILSSL